MAKMNLIKIQVSVDNAMELLSKLYKSGNFEQKVVDISSPKELALIQDNINKYKDYISRLRMLATYLDIDTKTLSETTLDNHSFKLDDLSKKENRLQSFLDNYEKEIPRLFSRRKELKREHKILSKLSFFNDEVGKEDLTLDLLSSSPATYSAIGEIPSSYVETIEFYCTEITKGQLFFWSTDADNPHNKLIFLITLKEYQNEIDEILQENYFDPSEFDLSMLIDTFSSVKDSEVTIKSLYGEVSKELEAVSNKLLSMKDDLKSDLLEYSGILNFVITLYKMQEKARIKDNVFTIWGWVSKRDYSNFKQDISLLSQDIKLTVLSDVPFPYKKLKEEQEEFTDLTIKQEEEVKTSKTIPPHDEHHGVHGEDHKGGALFPEQVTFIKLEAPVKKSRKFVSFVRSLDLIHPEKIGLQSETIQKKLNERKLELNKHLATLVRLKDNLGIDGKLTGRRTFEIPDDYSKSIDFIQQFFDEYEDKITKLANSRNDLKNKREKIELYLPFEGYFRDTRGSLAILDGGFQTCTFLGTLPHQNLKAVKFFLKEVTDGSMMLWESGTEDRKRNERNVLILALDDYESSITRVLEEYSFKPFDLDVSVFDEGTIPELMKQYDKEIEENVEALDSFKDEIQDKLVAVEELINVELEKIETEDQCRSDDECITLWGWVPTNKLAELKNYIDNQSMKIILTENPQVPITNPSVTPKGGRAFGAIRGLVSGMGAPAVYEADPYRIMRFTFPIIFGIMFADVGHGLMLMLIGLFFSIRKHRRGIKPDESMSGYLYAGGELLAISGFAAIIFGFLFGSILGDEVLLEHFYHKTLHINWLPIIKPLEEIQLFLVFSLVVGFISMQIGIWMRFVQNKKYGHGRASWIAPIFLSLLYVGIFLIIYNIIAPGAETHLFPLRDANGNIVYIDDGHGHSEPAPYVFQPLPKIVSTIAMILIGITLPGMFITEYIHEKTEGILEGIDYIISLFSNTLSFSRLLAMLLVHAILSGLPFTLGGIDTHSQSALSFGSEIGVGWVAIIWWLVAIIWGLFFIVPVEGLFSFLNTLRLHWVEIMTKWFKGEGKAYAPLTESLNYIQYIPAEGK